MIVVLILLTVVHASVGLFLLKVFPRKKAKRRRKAPKLIAHRGVVDGEPENSLQGFERCEKDQVDLVEFDVQLTKDKRVVIFHDDTLERVFPDFPNAKQVSIDQLNLEELPTGIPTLEDALTTMKTVPILIELKQDTKELVQLVKETIDQHGNWKNVSWGHFGKEELNNFCRMLKPGIPTVYSAEAFIRIVLYYIMGILPFVSIEPGNFLWVPNDMNSYLFLQPMMQHLSKRRGLIVVACNYENGSINTLPEITQAFKAGATTISTDSYTRFPMN